MGNYLYNGVGPLPKLPDYLRPPYSDKVFPYWWISLFEYEGVTLVALTATTTQPYFTGSAYAPTTNGHYALCFLYDASHSHADYEKLEQYDELFWAWNQHGEFDMPLAGENKETAIWSNFNLLNEDNTVHLAASDPVPVSPVNPAALMQGFATMLSLRRNRT